MGKSPSILAAGENHRQIPSDYFECQTERESAREKERKDSWSDTHTGRQADRQRQRQRQRGRARERKKRENGSLWGMVYAEVSPLQTRMVMTSSLQDIISALFSRTFTGTSKAAVCRYHFFFCTHSPLSSFWAYIFIPSFLIYRG